MVRASSYNTIFDKGNLPNWTNENFTVSQTVPPSKGTKRRVYKWINYNDEPVKGSYYQEELQKLLNNHYRIETVMKRRTLFDNTIELFVC